MSQISCSLPWEQTPDGFIRCTGTIQEQPISGLSLEDASELKDQALILFAVVFGILALKKALNL
jgi:hypothetical protein